MNPDDIPFVRPTDSERNRVRVAIERKKFEENRRDAQRQATSEPEHQGRAA